MDTLVDDIGSFPFPLNVNKEKFNQAYQVARETAINKKDFKTNDFLEANFNPIILGAFKKKLASGLDVANYPQLYSGINQISDLVHLAMEKGSYTVPEEKAVLPEIHLIAQEAKNLSEEFGKKIQLRASIFGPFELYLQEVGTKIYPDMLLALAETVRRFAKNSIIDSKYIQTKVVSIDEPSLGYIDLEVEPRLFCEVIEKAFDFKGAVKQIHLHSASKLHDLLCVKNLEVLSFEYAASPQNIEAVPKRFLDDSDKQIRVGISRTDINSMVAELADKGISEPSNDQLVETEDTIKRRYVLAKEKYGERLAFTGPDCGLNGMPSQESAQLLLERTVKAVRTINNTPNLK